MLKARLVVGLCVSMAVFACSPADMTGAALNLSAPGGAAGAGSESSVQTQYLVTGYKVSVPRSLLVSEADVYLPRADIVWHGDPAGDRYKQVQTIFETALAHSTQDMTRGRAVTVTVELQKFHALTPKTRATIGGNYAMHFILTVRDAQTGQVLDGPREVVGDTKASGGVRALREEQQGITQKSVILGHLIKVFDQELARPGRPASATGVVSRNDFSAQDMALAE